MALRDRLPEQPYRRAPGKVCSVCWLLTQVEPDQAAEAVELIAARTYTDNVLAEALREEYRIMVADYAIGRHRRDRHDERGTDGSA